MDRTSLDHRDNKKLASGTAVKIQADPYLMNMNLIVDVGDMRIKYRIERLDGLQNCTKTSFESTQNFKRRVSSQKKKI